MRFLRLLVVLLISLSLIVLALANRNTVELNLLPAEFATALGLSNSITLPLFLVILMGVLIGLLIGFIWEYLREYKHRKELSTAKKEVRNLTHEVKKLRNANAEPSDDILALIDD